jgi:hypothetical protein
MMHDLARWHTLSLADQLGNIGSEVHRARVAQGMSASRFDGAVRRLFELIDGTLSDVRWQKRLYELGRMREVVADAVLGGNEYGGSLKDLEPYFDQFAKLALKHTR